MLTVRQYDLWTMRLVSPTDSWTVKRTSKFEGTCEVNSKLWAKLWTANYSLPRNSKFPVFSTALWFLHTSVSFKVLKIFHSSQLKLWTKMCTVKQSVKSEPDQEERRKLWTEKWNYTFWANLWTSKYTLSHGSQFTVFSQFTVRSFTDSSQFTVFLMFHSFIHTQQFSSKFSNFLTIQRFLYGFQIFSQLTVETVNQTVNCEAKCEL